MGSVQKSIIIYCVMSFLIFAAACFQQISSLSLIIISGIALLLIILLKNVQMDTFEMFQLEESHKKNLILILLVLFIFFAHVLIIPPYMRDDIIYHLLIPKQLVAQGGFRFDPYNINSNFPMVFELPLTLSIISKGWISPFIVNYLVLLCLCVGFYSIARRIFYINHPLALMATVLIATTPTIYDQIRSCYVECFMSLLVLVIFYNYFLFRTRRTQTRFWYLTMLFAGFLCSTKYTGGVYVLFLIGVEFFSNKNRTLYYKGVLICTAICLPWYLKNWILLGNPFFPLLNFMFSSEHISIERYIYFKHLFADYNCGRTGLDYLLLPFRLLTGCGDVPTHGGLGFGGRLSFFYICSFASVAYIFRKLKISDLGRNNQLVGLLFVFYALFWAFTSQQVRFLLPVLILASLSGLSLINDNWKHLKTMTLIVMTIILVQNAFNIGMIMKKERIDDLILGKISSEQFLDYRMPISHKMANKLNQILDPQVSCLLTIGSFGRNYFYNMRVITNTYFEAEILAEAFEIDNAQPEMFNAFVEKEGISHLMINFSFFDNFFKNDASFDKHAFKKYLDQKTVILRQNAVVVYEL